MAIISGVAGVGDLVLKANELLSRLAEDWYKGNSEFRIFKSNLMILSLRTAQWESQLKQQAEAGVSEHPVLTALLAIASELLDAEEKYYEKHRKSNFRKWKKKLFPGKLTNILIDILQIVEAGPGLLAESVQTHDLLRKKFQMEPSLLPFGYDPMYVPLQSAIDEVQKAVEDEDGPQVVTLHGGPGTGKSSLAKCVALRYQDAMRGSTSCSFDGVQYLFCGKGCAKNIHQLQRALFSNLGLSAVFGANVQGEYNLSTFQSALRQVLCNRRMLIILDDVWRDDFEVLISLVSRGSPCKYLLTSQTRNVWPEAWSMQMPRLSEDQALEILTKHLERYSTNSHLLASSSGNQLHTSLSRNYLQAALCGSHFGKTFGGSNLQQLLSGSETIFRAKTLKGKLLEMVTRVGYHPLSLVNLAISVAQSGAIDSNQCTSFAQNNIFAFLEHDHERFPVLVYERRYCLSVSASMLLMVDSLQDIELNTLLVISSLGRNSEKIPEEVVRFLMTRFYDAQSSHFIFQYISALKFLEDNSLVQVQGCLRQFNGLVKSQKNNSMTLTVHKLRQEFVIRKRLPELQNILTNVVTGRGDHHHDTSIVNIRDNDQALAIVLGAMYFDHDLRDVVAPSFQSLMRQLDGDPIPRFGELLALSTSGAKVPRSPVQRLVDAGELVDSAEHLLAEHHSFVAIDIATGLLNLEGEELWKQQAHSNASKIITKFVCKTQFDDESMAFLLTTPFTTRAAVKLFFHMSTDVRRRDLPYGFQRKAFSEMFPATWNALSYLLYSKKLPVDVMPQIIRVMLESEAESKLSIELQKLREYANRSPCSEFEIYLNVSFLHLHLSRLTFEAVKALNLQKDLPNILWKFIQDDHDQVGRCDGTHVPSAGWSSSDIADFNTVYRVALRCIIQYKGYMEILLRFPVPCEEWLANAHLFRRLLQLEGMVIMTGSSTLKPWKMLLGVLSDTPEFRVEAAEVLKGERWKEVDFTLWPESYDFRQARFWGNVALLRDIDDRTKHRLVEIATNWSAQMSEYYTNGIEAASTEEERESMEHRCVGEVMRTVTIISHLHANLPMPHFPLSPADWKDAKSTSAERMICTGDKCRFYVETCWGQAKAYHRMEIYGEALRHLNLALQACNAIQGAFQKHLYMSIWAEERINYYASAGLRLHTMLLRALSKDYRGAMDVCHQGEHFIRRLGDGWSDLPQVRQKVWLCGNRAVSRRLSGDFLRSIDDFNEALELWETIIPEAFALDEVIVEQNWLKFCLLEHRGHAKYLMQDLEGSKLDRQSAADWRLRHPIIDPISWEFLHFSFFSEQLVKYSLLQLPIYDSVGL